MEYYNTLKQLHKTLMPDVYLEVGIRAGESFRLAHGKTKAIGIDPDYELLYPYTKNSILAKTTGDRFFASDKYKKMLKTSTINFAFIDGMHLFEYALRDFINIEKYSNKSTVIAIHDCIVRDKKSASRTRKTSFWTGDVWKVVKILEKFRPDLKIIPLDSAPSGLVLITNLDPTSRVLSENYNSIEKDYKMLSYTPKDHRIETVSTKEFNFDSLLNYRTRMRRKAQNIFRRLHSFVINKPKALGVLLCYNDADILEDSIKSLISNKHELIIWDHGSTDSTDKIIKKFSDNIIEHKFVPRSFDFYKLYPAMSKNLMSFYIDKYDWISWPDQDEILEGPNREKSYYEHITEVFKSSYDWIEFRNMNFWFTELDNPKIASPTKRIKYYSYFKNVSPRIRSWRSNATNVRIFNHNKPLGKQYPKLFNLRHYPMRSKIQMKQRIEVDRKDIKRGDKNFHYENMQKKIGSIKIKSSDLIFDNGKSPLSITEKFNWDKLYRKK